MGKLKSKLVAYVTKQTIRGLRHLWILPLLFPVSPGCAGLAFQNASPLSDGYPKFSGATVYSYSQPRLLFVVMCISQISPSFIYLLQAFAIICQKLMIMPTARLYFYFLYLKWGSDNWFIVAPRNNLWGYSSYHMFSDVPTNHKDWKEKIIFLGSKLLMGSALVWHPQSDNTYSIDVPTLSLAEGVDANRIFNSINVLVPLEFVRDIFDLEGSSFFPSLLFIDCLVTLSSLCSLFPTKSLWALHSFRLDPSSRPMFKPMKGSLKDLCSCCLSTVRTYPLSSGVIEVLMAKLPPPMFTSLVASTIFPPRVLPR